MKKFLTHLILIIFSLIVAIVLLEVALRIFLPHFLSIKRFKLVEGNFEYHNKKDIIRPSNALGYEFIPNSIDRINSLGMQDKKRAIEKPDGVFRIIFLGDSITANGAIPMTLEKRLNKNFNQKKYEVWNCAVGGYQVSQYAKYLKHRGLSFQPDCIIVGLCLNDFSYSQPVVYKTKEGKFFEYYNNAPRVTRYFVNSFLFRVSWLYRFILFKGEEIVAEYEKSHHNDFPLTEGLFWVGKINTIAEEMDIPLLFVVYPYLMPVSEYTSKQLKQYKIICRVLEHFKVDYVDLVKECNGINLYDLRHKDQLDDFFHPNNFGDKLYVEKIYNRFSDNNF